MIFILDVTADAPPYEAAESAAATVVGAIVPPSKPACANELLIICEAA